jgi:hypothetical protein
MLSGMGNKDARKRETKKPKKKEAKPDVNQRAATLVRKIASKP